LRSNQRRLVRNNGGLDRRNRIWPYTPGRDGQILSTHSHFNDHIEDITLKGRETSPKNKVEKEFWGVAKINLPTLLIFDEDVQKLGATHDFPIILFPVGASGIGGGRKIQWSTVKNEELQEPLVQNPTLSNEDSLVLNPHFSSNEPLKEFLQPKVNPSTNGNPQVKLEPLELEESYVIQRRVPQSSGPFVIKQPSRRPAKLDLQGFRSSIQPLRKITRIFMIEKMACNDCKKDKYLENFKPGQN
jgi:hypothetical protein